MSGVEVVENTVICNCSKILYNPYVPTLLEIGIKWDDALKLV